MQCDCGQRTGLNTCEKKLRKADDWLTMRLSKVLLSPHERNNANLKELSRYQVQSQEPFKFFDKGQFNGMRLCWQRCMPFVMGVSESSLRRAKLRVREGQTTYVHKGRAQKRKPNRKHDTIVAWIQDLEDNYGESTPDDKAKSELPPGCVCGYWADYVVEMMAMHRQHATYEYFRALWRKYFPNLYIPKSPRWVSYSVMLTPCHVSLGEV